MAKRFSDTDKWKKPFIRGLQAPYKLLWFYILDDCDHAGVWHVDFDVAKIRIGEDVNLKTALSVFGDKVQVIANGSKWFINDFIDFQYGELNPANRVHNSVLDILKKNGVNLNKPLTSPLEGAIYKDKDKDKDKDRDLEWFKNQLDPIWKESTMMAHRGKDFDQAVKESFIHMSSDSLRLQRADSADCKRLVNSWLAKSNKTEKQNSHNNGFVK